MIERPVRELHSDKRIQPLFCKVIVDGDNVTLESKGKDNKKTDDFMEGHGVSGRGSD